MRKLFVTVPVLSLLGIWSVASCGSSDQGGVTGPSGTGTGGSTGSAGTPTTGAGGSGASTATGGSSGTSTGGSAGSPTGAGGATPGTGGSATVPDASTSTGAGGAPPGTGGATGGTAGSTTTGSGGAPPVRDAGGTRPDASAPPPVDAGGGLAAVAAALNGKMLTGACVVEEQASVCHTVAAAATCPTNADPALAGVHTTDNTITLGGDPTQMYTIVLHVQGEVESKTYPGGTDRNSTANSPAADGWAMGGVPTNGNAYNVYMIRVTNPGAATHTDYFLNSLEAPGVSNHTTYGIDYTTPAAGQPLALRAMGGASLRLVAADANCDMIKNCGPAVNNGSVCSAPIVQPNIEPDAIRLNPNFPFNTVFNGQWLVMTVKSVTSP
jgi:hypothetical protein